LEEVDGKFKGFDDSKDEIVGHQWRIISIIDYSKSFPIDCFKLLSKTGNNEAFLFQEEVFVKDPFIDDLDGMFSPFCKADSFIFIFDTSAGLFRIVELS
jgi:hypothetical protein